MATLLNSNSPIEGLNNLDLSPGDAVYFDSTAAQPFLGTVSFDRNDALDSSGHTGTAITVTSWPLTNSVVSAPKDQDRNGEVDTFDPSWGQGWATINAGTGDGIYVENAAGFDISDLKLVGTSATLVGNLDKTLKKNLPAGINFATRGTADPAPVGSINITNVETSGFWQAGIYFQTGVAEDWSNYLANPRGFSDVNITNCWVHGSDSSGSNSGIEFIGYGTSDSTNVTIEGCTADHNLGHAGMDHNTGSGIVLSSVDGGMIQDSVAFDNGDPGYGGIGIWAWRANNITIQSNESYRNRTSNNKDGGGFDLDGGVTNSVMQYNYSHDNEGSGYGLFQWRGAPPYGHNVIRYNISRNDARANDAAGISLWNGGSGVVNSDIYGNTVYLDETGLAAGGTPHAIEFATKTTNIHVYNNIFMTRDGIQLMDVAGGQQGIVFKGNDLYAEPVNGADVFKIRWGKTYTDLAKWRKSAGQSGNICCDPQFVHNDGLILGTAEDFRLNPISSMLKNAGTDVFSLLSPGSRDFFNDNTPGDGGFAIGADEL